LAHAASDLHERERVRLGFDLHDGPAQLVSAALLQVKMLEDLDGEELRQGLAELRGTLVSALAEMYELIENLGGKGLEHEGVVAKLESLTSTFAEHTGIRLTMTVEGAEPATTTSLQVAIFRIVQEALSNVSRHSGARQAEVHLFFNDREVGCDIRDDGTGFDPNAQETHTGIRARYGLNSMRERARLLDGCCTIESRPGDGTLVWVRIPLWQG
jgi:two-component system sensor histidine kinase DegS